MGRRKRINVLSLLVVHDILIVHIQSKYYISGRARKVWGGGSKLFGTTKLVVLKNTTFFIFKGSESKFAFCIIIPW